MSSVLLVTVVVPHPVPVTSSARHSVVLLAWWLATIYLTATGGVHGQPVECHRPPLDVHPKDCCRMPPLLDEAILAGCKQIHGGEELKRGVAFDRGNCFTECAMNATGIMTNGRLDLDRTLQLVASSGTGSAAVKTAISGACVRCFQEGQQQRLQQAAGGSPAVTGKYCSNEAAQFLSCVNMESFKTCLHEYWTNSSACITLRKFIESCPIPS